MCNLNMKKSMSRLHLTYGIYLSLLWCTSTQGQTAPNITGYGGETTLFTCPIAAINPGDNYVLLKDSTAFYDNGDNGNIISGKYNATAGNGEIKLQILNTNISDAGKYTCSHNFNDTSGYVSVAFIPENITTDTAILPNGWQLTATATKVFPNDTAISSVICLKPDNANISVRQIGQSVNPNSDIPYLFDISWKGAITEHLSGEVPCTFTFVTIEKPVKTNVTFQEPDSTSKPCQDSCVIVGVVVGGMVVVGGVVVVRFVVPRKT